MIQGAGLEATRLEGKLLEQLKERAVDQRNLVNQEGQGTVRKMERPVLLWGSSELRYEGKRCPAYTFYML